MTFLLESRWAELLPRIQNSNKVTHSIAMILHQQSRERLTPCIFLKGPVRTYSDIFEDVFFLN